MSKGHPGQEKGYHTQGSVYCIYIFIIVLVKLVCLLCTERKFQTSVASRLASLFHLMILLFRGHGIKFHEIQKSGQGWQRGRCLIDFVAFSKSRHDCCPAIPHSLITVSPAPHTSAHLQQISKEIFFLSCLIFLVPPHSTCIFFNPARKGFIRWNPYGSLRIRILTNS